MRLDISRLTRIAARVRKDILEMSFRAQSAHTGGSLSCVELLITLYFSILRVDPAQTNDIYRDRLIFSKAHDAKALYAVLARRGFFPKSWLSEYEQDGGRLSGHATNSVPGVEISAGSLGHGLSIGAGMAYGIKCRMLNDECRMKKTEIPRVFVVLSDGECDEGSTWEAALFAGHHRLSNLIAIIDYNMLQGFGKTDEVLTLAPFENKWKSFGWDAVSIDGHSISDIHRVLNSAYHREKPYVVISHTTKGYGGVPSHMNRISSQYVAPTYDELRDAVRKLIVV